MAQMIKNLILVVAAGLLLTTLAPERGGAVTVPQISAGSASLVVQVRARCTRLLRRCNRGNTQACQLYQFECLGARPIY